MTVLTQRVGVINIPSKVKEKAWRRCWRETKQRADIFGCNEIFLKAAKRALSEEAKAAGYAQFGIWQGPNPVFWNKAKYRRKAGKQHRLHGKGSMYHRFPGFNDERFVTEVVLVDRETKREFAVLCTHWVPEGRRTTMAFREMARLASRRGVNRLIKEHLREGRVVYFMGDTNIWRKIRLHKMRWLRGEGIDKIGVAVPAGVEVVAAKATVFPAPTDHKHGVAGRARLRYS